MKTTQPVVAVIPNYNMGWSLISLLPQVLRQHYDAVYVLDDASTDSSCHLLEAFLPKITLIRGHHNLGAGANRNRILKVKDRRLESAILHFIDADVDLNSERNPELIRRLIRDDSIGMIGGLVEFSGGHKPVFNYGPRFSLYSLIGAIYQQRLEKKVLNGQKDGARYQQKKRFWLKDFPDILGVPRPREVFWVSEANLVMPFRVFRELGGFDPKLRYHEIQDLAIRLHEAGYQARFEPTLSVIHPPLKPATELRRLHATRASWHLLHTYGLHFH